MTRNTHTHTVVIKIDNKILLKTKNRVFRTLDCIPLCFVSFDIRNSFGSVIDKNKTEHISNYNDARPPILSLWSNLIAQNPILKQRVHKLKQKRKRVHNNNELEKSKLLTETRTEGNKRERERKTNPSNKIFPILIKIIFTFACVDMQRTWKRAPAININGFQRRKTVLHAIHNKEEKPMKSNTICFYSHPA